MLPASGIVLLDKPQGVSSQGAVTRFKHTCHVSAAGHTGTLDPIATGLLVICFGRATRLSEFLIGCDKRYTALLRIGAETDTCDSTGIAVRTSDVRPTVSEVEAVLKNFTGGLLQVPPVFSAIKKNGQQLYKLARRGEAEEPPARSITVYSISLTNADEAAGEFELSVFCSKGTYIRSLCRDIARALGTAGTMAALRRTSAGSFSIENAYTPEQIAEMTAAGDFSFVQPTDSAFAGLPSAYITPEGERLLRCGADIPDSCVNWSSPSRSRLYSRSGEFLAVILPDDSTVKVEKRYYEV